MTPEQVIALAALLADMHTHIGHLQSVVEAQQVRIVALEEQLAEPAASVASDGPTWTNNGNAPEFVDDGVASQSRIV